LVLVLCLAAGSAFAAGKNAVFYNNAGYEYLAKGEPVKAQIQFRSALRQNPSYKEALLGMAKADLALDAWRDAFDFFTKVIKLDADNIDAMTGMGFAYIGLANYDRALEQFTDVIKKSENAIEAHYGTAYLYYIMNKNLWATRKIATILRMNPYHYETLLLAGDIKREEGRFEEAEEFIQTALDDKKDNPEGYIRYAALLNERYLAKGDADDLSAAIEQIRRALAIQGDNFKALNYLGYLHINENRYDAALDAFEKARLVNPDSAVLSYDIGLAYEKKGDRAKALEAFEKARAKNLDDEVNLCRLENFLVAGEFKIGSPLRISLSEQHYKTALLRSKEHLGDGYLYHLRRALYLNPLLREARERFLQYNFDEGYDNLYIDELKNLQKLFPNGDYGNALNVAVMKRRNRVYHEAGYSMEEPPRDVPNVVVLNFVTPGGISYHPAAGEIIADNITFSIQQFGRMATPTVPERRELLASVQDRPYKSVDDILTELADKLQKKNDAHIDYIVYGEFREKGQALYLDYKLMDFKTGVIIAQDTLYDREKDKLARLALRAARFIYDKVPYKGRVLSIDDDKAVVNLGLYDGLKAGDILYVDSEHDAGVKGKYIIKKKILFKIDEADTVVSRISAVDKDEAEKVREEMAVFPLSKRRAVKIR
jgi:tetratricopeptide (TPR) repeat protein